MGRAACDPAFGCAHREMGVHTLRQHLQEENQTTLLHFILASWFCIILFNLFSLILLWNPEAREPHYGTTMRNTLCVILCMR